MQNVGRSILIVVMLLAGVQSHADSRDDMYKVKRSEIILGQIKDVYSNKAVQIVECGYYLTKGAVYESWGPSLTFFIKRAGAKNREVLYHMLNGTRQLDPIESLNIQTADDHEINKSRHSYLSIYRKNLGRFLPALIPTEKIALSVERALGKNKNYESQSDKNILSISYNQSELRKKELRYQETLSLECGFNKSIKIF